MNCRSVLNLLPLHVGGDLPPGRAAALEAHLRACPECSGQMAAFRDCRLLFQSAQAPFERAAAARVSCLWPALAPRLDALDAVVKLRQPWYRRRSAAAAAVLLLAAVPVYLLGSVGWGGGAPAGPGGPGGAAPPASFANHPASAADGEWKVASPGDLEDFISRYGALEVPAARHQLQPALPRSPILLASSPAKDF